MRINLEALAATFKDVEFFLVCLYPPSAARFEGQVSADFEFLTSDDHWSITAKASQNGQGLMTETSAGLVLFRGYDADLGVHTYSPPATKEKISSPADLGNGVFSYIRVSRSGRPAIVKGDALGVAPLYYRALPGGGYLLSSHPTLLRLGNDKIDLRSWMSMMQNGFCYGNHSFYEEIHRLPAGVQLTMSRDGIEKHTWFDINSLPEGNQTIDDEAFQIVEDCYAAGMQKLLALRDSRILPLSSGYDSRRFFATMVENNTHFKAVTCQTFHRKMGRDYELDSVFAPQLAKKFGVDCTVVSATPPEGFSGDGIRRMSLIGSESFLHGWAVPLMKWMAEQPMSIIFDGLAGDTLGNSGYEFTGLHESHGSDIDVLVKETVDESKFKQLSNIFPSIEEFIAGYRSYLEEYPKNLNGAELAFLQGRTRRCISPWITMMHPPGHVVVYPYYDLGFVRATLRYHPAEKYKWFFQKECLKRFHPAYFDFPGSRNIPPGILPRSQERLEAMERQAEEFNYADRSAVIAALKYLTPGNKIFLLISAFFPPLRHRRNWLFGPLLQLVKTDRLQNKIVEMSP